MIVLMNLCTLHPGRYIVCVRERHESNGSVLNDVVSVPVDGSREPCVLARCIWCERVYVDRVFALLSHVNAFIVFASTRKHVCVLRSVITIFLRFRSCLPTAPSLPASHGTIRACHGMVRLFYVTVALVDLLSQESEFQLSPHVYADNGSGSDRHVVVRSHIDSDARWHHVGAHGGRQRRRIGGATALFAVGRAVLYQRSYALSNNYVIHSEFELIARPRNAVIIHGVP